MTDEQRKMIVEMYKGGRPLSEIEKSLGMARKTISRECNEMIASGLLEKRNRINTGWKKTTKTTQVVIAMYNDGKSEQEIADELECTLSNVSHIVKKLVDNGTLIKREKQRVKKPRKPRAKFVKRPTEEQKIVVNNEPVRCNCKVARSCIYGQDSNMLGLGKCNFVGCTGQSRMSMSPSGAHIPTEQEPYTECYLYSKISKDNPRRSARHLFTIKV